MFNFNQGVSFFYGGKNSVASCGACVASSTDSQPQETKRSLIKVMENMCNSGQSLYRKLSHTKSITNFKGNVLWGGGK